MKKSDYFEHENNILKTNIDQINPTTYIVKKGDTLFSIANKYGLSSKKIYEKNKNIIKDKTSNIKPGQLLVLDKLNN